VTKKKIRPTADGGLVVGGVVLKKEEKVQGKQRPRKLKE